MNTRTGSKLSEKMKEQGYLPSSEVAKRIGMHRATIYRWINAGVVEFLDMGGGYYVRWESVLAHLGEVATVLGLTADLSSEGATE